RANSYTTGNQWAPRVAADAAGDFVAAWESFGQDGDQWGAYAQRYAAPPPRVRSLAVNGGAAQRSMVTSAAVTFDAAVSLPADPATAFTLTRTGGGAVGFTATASVVGGVTVV